MKYKLVIADDEPLVLVGLQSMLDWDSFGITVAGVARNGVQLMELIEAVSPDIVITDIRMPVKSGLEVMRECSRRFGRLPLFVVLTSHEEYGYVKEAISYQAVNFLVKIELTRDTLAESINRSISILRDLEKHDSGPTEDPVGHEPFLEKFFVRLLNGLVETREQYLQQKQDLGLDIAPRACCAAYFEIRGIDTGKMGKDKFASLYSSTIGMARETISQYYPCVAVSLDPRHFAVLLYAEGGGVEGSFPRIKEALVHAVALVRNYFAVELTCSAGCAVDDLYRIHESFPVARRIHSLGSSPDSVTVFDPGVILDTPAFDMGKYREKLSVAFRELDFEGLAFVLDEICGNLELAKAGHACAMDVACGILFMAISLLPEGEEIISSIFESERDGYRCIYEYKTEAECRSWIHRLRDGLVAALQGRKQDYRERIVTKVQRYIDANLGRKLTLGEVSSVFGFSQNYLSSLFSRYGGCSFVEYTTGAKIRAAKTLMAGEVLKINEIADRLGFESAFYFSKVFKKVEGVSPRDFMRKAGKHVP
ncbi:MAG: hypothetical protein A2413_08255 [Treponema sp. RIFOXYC1_FULL_61_9]|nr:MAG: hypothetical protein A2413_08255 [Treponema sp. RIFOXYC1_FULL_61_9]